MKQIKGRSFGNAETTIDLDKRSVRFKYPIKDLDTNTSFFNHNMVGFLTAISFFLIFFLIDKWIMYKTTNLGVNSIYQIGTSIFYSMVFFGAWYFFGTLSIIIHQHSKKARDWFPKTNAFYAPLAPKKKIDLRRKIGKKYIVIGKKLYLFGYDIDYFKWSYEGKNKIKRIKTKCVEQIKKGRREDVTKFIAIIEFKDIIKSGKFNYW